jgi:hypothetical protein
MFKTDGPGQELSVGTETNTVAGVSYNYDYLSSYKYRESRGTSTPGYRKLLRAGGLLPLTEWYQYEGEMTDGSGSWDLTDMSPGYPAARFTGSTLLPSIQLHDVVPNLSDLATVGNRYLDDYYIEAALAALYGSGFDNLTFTAELRSTAALFLNIKRRLISKLLSVDPKLWANAWLEGRYGWRTLIYDLKSLQAAYERLSESDQPKVWKQTKGSSFSETSTQSTTSGNAARTTNFTVVTNYNVSVRGYVVSMIRPPTVTNDLGVTAWELVPFSFVVDWFVSIGVNIQALYAASYHSDYQSSLGLYVTGARSVSYSSTTNGAWTGHCDGNASGFASYTLRSPKKPDFLPQAHLNLNDFKIADLVAILTQRLRR